MGRICSKVDCSRVVLPNRPCPQHPPRARFGGGQMSPEFKRNRRIVMRVKPGVEPPPCGLCGGAALPDDQCDHKRPRSQGGGDEITNLQRVHAVCHDEKSARESRSVA